jgi:hypothetical protein
MRHLVLPARPFGEYHRVKVALEQPVKGNKGVKSRRDGK